MQKPTFRTSFLAVTAAFVMSLFLPAIAFDDDERTTSSTDKKGGKSKDDSESMARFKDVVEAQALYEKVLRLGVGGPHTGPYTAPIHTDPTGPSHLWGGLDPISLIDRHNEDIGTDAGGVLFISRSGSNVGKPEFYLDVPIYTGSSTLKRALFRSAENRDRYLQMISDGSLMIMFGLNCQWGIISGPATDFLGRGSHWAQPGLAAIAVERFFKGKVTVLGVNLYSRGDDWNATKEPWKHAITAFNLLLTVGGEWERERIEMPVIKVN